MIASGELKSGHEVFGLRGNIPAIITYAGPSAPLDTIPNLAHELREEVYRLQCAGYRYFDVEDYGILYENGMIRLRCNRNCVRAGGTKRSPLQVEALVQRLAKKLMLKGYAEV